MGLIVGTVVVGSMMVAIIIGLMNVSVLRGYRTKTGGRVGGACRGRDDVTGGNGRQ